MTTSIATIVNVITLKATTYDADTANVSVILADGRSWSGLVTPSDLWMSPSLHALCEEITEAPGYGRPMAVVIHEHAEAHLAAPA